MNRTPIHSKQELDQALAGLSGQTATLILLFQDADGKAHQQALTLRL
jgi:hypothetical protein